MVISFVITQYVTWYYYQEMQGKPWTYKHTF